MTNKEFEEKRRAENDKLILARMRAETQREKDIINLKMIVNSIRPYSRWYRWGYIGSLKRAIRALEKDH